MMFKKLPFAVLVSTFAVSAPSHALDIGLEATARVETSDNVGSGVRGTEEGGQIGYLELGVYGEQRGRIFQAGFSGELATRSVLSDSDDTPDTLNNFFGAATVLLTPAFSWYFGDVLGTVQTSGDLLSFVDEETERRNVFVTGPSFNYRIDNFSSVLAEVLYFKQDQDNTELAQLVTARAEWRKNLRAGTTLGISVDDIYTDEPSLDDGEELNPDTNRLSAAAFWERDRGLSIWYASLGGTRFETSDEAVNGLNAELRLTRRLGPETEFVFSLGSDLTNESILTVNSLLEDGAGLVPEATGVFRNNNVEMAYQSSSTLTSYELGVRGSSADFQLLDVAADGRDDPTLDDNVTVSAFGSLSRILAPRWNLFLGFELENQRFTNVEDDLDSIRASIELGYKISESFRVSAGLRSTGSEGISTRDNISLAADGSFKIIENRALLQLTWAPPSRATQEQVVQLKQLLR